MFIKHQTSLLELDFSHDTEGEIATENQLCQHRIKLQFKVY